LEDVGFGVKVSGGDLECSGVDVDAEFVFDKGLIRVEYLSAIRLILFFLSTNDFLDYFLRFTFPLHKRQNMVDIVGNNVPFINEVYFSYFTFFRNYMNFFIL